MHSVPYSNIAIAVCFFAVISCFAGRAEARCYTFQESHNGTDLFNPGGGAKEAARIKLMESVEQWRTKKRLGPPRVGKISYRCDPWNLNYILPHHRCYAKARVCF